MRKVGLNTISAFSILFIPVLIFFVLFIHQIANMATDTGLTEGAYYQGVMSIVILYLILSMFPTGFNLTWEAFKEKRKLRFLFLIGYLLFLGLTMQVLMNGILVILFVLTVLLANKWMGRFAGKLKIIVACVPLVILSGYSVVALSVA